MAIERRKSPDEQGASKGRLLYETLRLYVQKLGTTDQITLGFAFQKGSAFGALSRQAQDAFDDAADDLDL